MTGAADEAGTTSSGDGGLSSTALRVSLQAEKVVLCPGECTELTARTEHASQDVSLSWNHGLAADVDIHKVCPSETTTYTVTADEPGASVEFSSQSATAKLTLDVKECKPDPRVACEARFRFEVPANGNMIDAKQPWASLNSYYDSALSPRADGSVVMVGSFGGRVSFGAEEIVSTGAVNTFVHVMDSNCKPLWTRSLSGTVPTDTLFGMAQAVDESGNIYVVSAGGPLVNFNPLVNFPIGFTTEMLVFKLSSTGEQLYRTRLGIFFVAAAFSADVDANGNLYIAGVTHSYSDFGTGALGLSPTAFPFFMLALDPSGARKYHQIDTGVVMLTSTARQLLAARGGINGFDLLWIVGGVPGYETPTISGRSFADFSPNWTVPMTYQFDALASGGFVTAEPTYEHEMTATEYIGVEETVTVRYDADGKEVRRRSLAKIESRTPLDDAGVPIVPDASTLEPGDPDAGEPVIPLAPVQPHRLAAGPAGEVAMASSLYGPVKIGDQIVEPKSSSSSLSLSNGNVVFKVDPEDTLQWVHKTDWGSDEWLNSLEVAHDGSVWIGGLSRPGKADGTTLQQDLVVQKLRGTR